MNPTPKILVVDDDKGLTLVLTVRLRSAGFVVEVCNSAVEASGAAVKMQPDVILLDVEMPSFTGLELHQCFQCASRLKDTPVVYLSGRQADSGQRMAMEQGAHAFVAKPYDPERLIAVLRGAIRRETVGL